MLSENEKFPFVATRLGTLIGHLKVDFGQDDMYSSILECSVKKLMSWNSPKWLAYIRMDDQLRDFLHFVNSFYNVIIS